MNNEQSICVVYSSAKAIGSLPASYFTYQRPKSRRGARLRRARAPGVELYGEDLAVVDRRVLPMLLSQGVEATARDRRGRWIDQLDCVDADAAAADVRMGVEPQRAPAIACKRERRRWSGAYQLNGQAA
jgi:hypothetical protein